MSVGGCERHAFEFLIPVNDSVTVSGISGKILSNSLDMKTHRHKTTLSFKWREEMVIKIPVIVTPLKEGGYMARCEEIRATAVGDTADDAIQNLREAIDDMVKEYGQKEVFQDLMPESHVQVIEVAV